MHEFKTEPSSGRPWAWARPPSRTVLATSHQAPQLRWDDLSGITVAGHWAHLRLASAPEYASCPAERRVAPEDGGDGGLAARGGRPLRKPGVTHDHSLASVHLHPRPTNLARFPSRRSPSFSRSASHCSPCPGYNRTRRPCLYPLPSWSCPCPALHCALPCSRASSSSAAASSGPSSTGITTMQLRRRPCSTPGLPQRPCGKRPLRPPPPWTDLPTTSSSRAAQLLRA